MNNTNISEEKFLEIFKKCLKVETRTISVKTLLSERNLKRIKYDPYYQRNYVWDKIKQSFFIESVILGTEIPPLIFFKSGVKIEVIDGRQRFETLKKFKENEFKLDGRGLMSLEFLAKESFKTLDENLRETFWSSNIRIFEYEVVNYPDLTNENEDKIKKEIFRRYNTGITPLTSSEVDNAKYIDDNLTSLFESYLLNNELEAKKMYKVFISNEDYKTEEIKNFFRKLYILNKFPISKYAGGANRVETLDILYDFAIQGIEDYETEFFNYISQINKVITFYDYFITRNDKLNNKLIYECLLWAIRILETEEIQYEYDLQKMASYYIANLENYTMLESHYYGNILKRFKNTADYFFNSQDIDFSIYIKDPNFSKDLKDKLIIRSESDDKIEKFQNLRYNKPAPISTPIEEIIADVKSNKYLVRPVYQRQEKISEIKASSIIESILLGINLPPIFVFKKINGTKEVIDGQQRLLSILGFLGEEYQNELGKNVLSKNNNFKLRGLKILKNLNGANYSYLSDSEKDKILDFTIDLIIIEEVLNKNFEPTDLFIRLNNKPYPIKQNSFEMWNSTVDAEVIKMIREVTNKHIEWFYVKETNSNPEKRKDRMDNEEFITILSYMAYNSNMHESYDKIIGFFRRNNGITCRLKYKTGVTDFLIKLEKEANEKHQFLKSIDITNKLITSLGIFLGSDNKIAKENLNKVLNISNKPIFRRSLQDFYIIWVYLLSFPNNFQIDQYKINQIVGLLKEFRNTNSIIIDDEYVDKFEIKLKGLYSDK